MGQVDDAIAYARQQIGKPYKFGAVGPDKFDCSGLIVAAYQHANPPINLPHWTGALIAVGSNVKQADLVPGDMVFPDSGHVQLYVGNGQIIEAAQDGVPIHQVPMWGFWQARRVTSGGANSIAAIGEGALGVIADMNPLKVGATAIDMLRPFGVAGMHIIDPAFWRRIGMASLGGFLIITGLIYFNRRSIIGATAGVMQFGASTVNTAVQGASFGVGAGKTGGLGSGGGAAGAVIQSKVPKPPPPANAPTTGYRPVSATPTTGPVSATPITAPVPEFGSVRGTARARAIGKATPPPRPLPGSKETPKPRRRAVPKVPGDVLPTVRKPKGIGK